jgi:hypothetical protein
MHTVSALSFSGKIELEINKGLNNKCLVPHAFIDNVEKNKLT